MKQSVILWAHSVVLGSFDEINIKMIKLIVAYCTKCIGGFCEDAAWNSVSQESFIKWCKFRQKVPYREIMYQSHGKALRIMEKTGIIPINVCAHCGPGTYGVVISPKINGKTIKEFIRQRRRWVSKSKSYTNSKIILTALVVLFFNLSIVSLFLSAFFIPALWSLYILLTLLKFFIDFPILKNITNFMNQGKILKWTLPLEFIYPFYAVFTAISGLLLNVNWKRN